MPVQVKWYKAAQLELERALQWGRENFGEQAAAEFFYRIMKFESLLQNNPNIGSRVLDLDTLKKQYRAVLVHDNYKLVYHWDERRSVIYVVSLWDVRRNPANLAGRLR